MRTTVTLDADVEAIVKQRMQQRGMSFKEVINDAIRTGMPRRPGGAAPDFPTHDMGDALVDVSKALRLAAELEDQELAARLVRGS